ncbi:winged helix-turn-helix transcriptional regulator [Candidatus Epulonipiscium viviparus]
MELTLDIIGGKWKPLIIFHIGNNQKLRYGELKRLVLDISK